EEAHKPNIHWKSGRGLVTEVDSFGKTYVASEEYPASPHDTRESPDNRPTPVDGKDLDSDDDDLSVFPLAVLPYQH
ncbi:hypothetical protein ACLBPS_29785, partial [Klebsiella pneumoniae]|uniref:hypothetical protein n=1 Tax=Klebsiella pneumoniae TaxID=573 RepID=UPI00396AA1D8